MKFGAQLYTVKDYMQNLEDFENTLKRVSEIGYKYVQVSGTCDFEAEWLKEKLEKAGCIDRANIPFQKAVFNKELPYTIGGGIGQSRLCMFLLRKAHIGEIQSSIWPEEMYSVCSEAGIELV